jgi:hypothetical protein
MGRDIAREPTRMIQFPTARIQGCLVQQEQTHEPSILSWTVREGFTEETSFGEVIDGVSDYRLIHEEVFIAAQLNTIRPEL